MTWLLLANAVLLVVNAVMLYRVTVARRASVHHIDPIERLSYGVEHMANVWQETTGATPLQEQTFRQIRRTCIDIQGAIEVFARWAVANMPELLEDMEPPEHWKLTVNATLGPLVTMDVNGCARCGTGHKEIGFRRFTNPLLAPGAAAMTHWAPCPKTGEPILMRFVDKN